MCKWSFVFVLNYDEGSKVQCLITTLWYAIWFNSHLICCNEYKLSMFILIPVADVISCQIDNAERDECMKAAISHILPKLHVSLFSSTLINGLKIKMLFTQFLHLYWFQSGLQALNIPPIDPLVHNNTVINFQRGQILQATGLVKTARVYGLSRAQIKRLKWVSICNSSILLFQGFWNWSIAVDQSIAVNIEHHN